MSVDYIVNHAILNVWCNPQQDLQSIVKPKRITRAIGVWQNFEAGKNTYSLPDNTSRFHVFQVGQLSPALMGLLETHGLWKLVADTCRERKVMVDIYSQFGIEFPRTQSWYMVTKNRNLLFAVKEVPGLLSLRENDIFLRVYTNAFFQSRRAGIMEDDIQIYGSSPATRNDIVAIQDLFNAWQQRDGATYAFVNGYKVSFLNLFTVAVGDYVEIVHDNSIRDIIEFPIKDLKAFTSTLDNKQKYLLHYPGQGGGTIDYHDDVDFFLVRKNPSTGRHRGVYYHRNAAGGDAVRMVTHKDYAIPVDYIESYAAKNPTWPVSELVLVAHIRYSGYHRPLIDENNRIKELYKMHDDDLIDAMLSSSAVVDNWTAAVLEQSAYTEIMRSLSANMTARLVQDAYGYNAITKILADSPHFVKLSSNQRTIELPYGLQQDSAMFEYDANGHLLGYYQHTQGAVYSCRNNAARLVEVLAGTISTRLDETYGQQVSDLDMTADYRFYTCGIEVGGVVNNRWEDVTDSGKYSILNGKVQWLTNPATTYTLVRGNRHILAYNLELDSSSGVVEFSLTHLANRGGSITNRVMQIPMGELDVFMNRRSLVEGVDYYVNFPQIVIVNKAYLNDNGKQQITVRFTGLCKSDLSREAFNERGFIDHGLLSANDRFDIRDDKVQRIVVGGALYDRRELLFAEEDAAVRVPDARNGLPYLIRDLVVPVRGLAADDTYELRAKSLVIDKKVSDYLTEKLPQQPFTNPNAIVDLYPVVSPFCAKLLFDLKNGFLVDPRIKSFYADADVYEICKPYEYLLAFDPTQDALRPDPKYVAIHPHHLKTVVEVDLYCYKFLARAVKLYLKDRVNLSHFLVLSA